ncbi:hypothetical protein [Luteococcus sp.]|uniref:hypothetical protein n=1 Tax=Luteococcus sp. TaxID=1969402 RepID=UPI0037355533
MVANNTFYRVCTRDELLGSIHEPFASLVIEWVELNESPSTSDAVARWGRLEPVLAGFSQLGAIPLYVDQAGVEDKDDVLAALLRLAQTGEPLAGRAVLHCMLPGLRRLYASRPMFRRGCERAGQRAGYDEADAEHLLISECWMQIMRYPLDNRPRKIASNLYWDTRKNAISKPGGELDLVVATDEEFDFQSDTNVEQEYLESVGIEKFAMDLSACIEWARSVDALSPSEAQLLIDTCVEHGMQRPITTNLSGHRNEIYLTIAEEQGLSYRAVVKQVSRAKARLVSAITDNLLAHEEPIFCAS